MQERSNTFVRNDDVHKAADEKDYLLILLLLTFCVLKTDGGQQTRSEGLLMTVCWYIPAVASQQIDQVDRCQAGIEMLHVHQDSKGDAARNVSPLLNPDDGPQEDPCRYISLNFSILPH